MSLSDNEKENMKKAEKEAKTSRMKALASNLLEALVEKVRGKQIKKQLEFLLDPDAIETSSRLKRNEVMAINNADFLGRHFKRFWPLRNFWMGVEKEYDERLFVDRKGGGYARWIVSIEGKRIQEAINFIGASREEKGLVSLLTSLPEKKRED